MSWETINCILGLAAIDPAFRQWLQQNSLAALEAQGFELASIEQPEGS